MWDVLAGKPVHQGGTQMFTKKTTWNYSMKGPITTPQETERNNKTVHTVATKFGIQLLGVEISCYPASKRSLLYSLYTNTDANVSTYNNELISWTASTLQMSRSYIHYSYLQIPCSNCFFCLICFRYAVCLKATRQKELYVPSYKNGPFWESKGTSKKTEHWVRREGFHLDSQQYSNFQQQTQTRSPTISRTPLHITITLLHCL